MMKCLLCGHKSNNKNVKSICNSKIFTLHWLKSTVSMYLKKGNNINVGYIHFFFPNWVFRRLVICHLVKSKSFWKSITLDECTKYLISKQCCLAWLPPAFLVDNIQISFRVFTYSTQGPKKRRKKERKNKLRWERDKEVLPQHFLQCILKLEITGIKWTFHSVIDFYFKQQVIPEGKGDTLLVQIKKDTTELNSRYRNKLDLWESLVFFT